MNPPAPPHSNPTISIYNQKLTGVLSFPHMHPLASEHESAFMFIVVGTPSDDRMNCLRPSLLSRNLLKDPVVYL